MSVKTLYPSKSNFLKADDLKGHAVRVIVENVSIATFDKGAKIVLAFAGKEKKLPLNKTNANIMADSFGDDENQWSGAEIELHPGKTTFQGELVDTIQVRIAAKAPSDEPIPF